MKIDTCKQKIFIEIIFVSVCILFGVILIVPFLKGILKLFNDYGIGFGLLLSSVGIILCVLWLCLLAVLFLAVRLLVKVLHLSISIENSSIAINHNNREWQITQEEIKYVLADNKGAMLIWNKDGEIKTFFVKKSYFTRSSFGDIISFLSNVSGYHDELDEKTKIRKQLDLNRIFRKNKLESEL